MRSQRLSADKLTHPNQKPVDLMVQLVESVTSRGDIVCDPFMGSGSTGEACIMLERSFIGVECDAGYYAMALSRLKQLQLRDFA